jgi:hypothetical protein
MREKDNVVTSHPVTDQQPLPFTPLAEKKGEKEATPA